MMVVSFRLIFVVLLALVIFESAAGGKASKKDKQATNEDSDEHSDANRKKETKDKVDPVDNDEDEPLSDENSGDADKDVANLLSEDDADEGIDDTDNLNEGHESGSIRKVSKEVKVDKSEEQEGSKEKKLVEEDEGFETEEEKTNEENNVASIKEDEYLTSNEVKQIERRDSNEILMRDSDGELFKETEEEKEMKKDLAMSEEVGSFPESLGKDIDDEAVREDTNEKQSSGDVVGSGGVDEQVSMKPVPPQYPMTPRTMPKNPHPPCNSGQDKECKTLMKNPKARCGPKKICYLAKPCRHSNECSAGFVCKIPGIIKKAKRAQRAQIIKNHMKRVHQSRRRSRDPIVRMQPKKIAHRKYERRHPSQGPVGYRLKRDTKKRHKIKSKGEDDGSSAVGSLDELLDERDDKKDSENEIFYDTEELVVTRRSSEKESTERKKNRKDINISLGDEENKKDDQNTKETEEEPKQRSNEKTQGGQSDKSISDIISEQQPDLTDSVSVGTGDSRPGIDDVDDRPTGIMYASEGSEELREPKLLGRQTVEVASKPNIRIIPTPRPTAPKPAKEQKVCVRRGALIANRPTGKTAKFNIPCANIALKKLNKLAVRDSQVKMEAMRLLSNLFGGSRRRGVAKRQRVNAAYPGPIHRSVSPIRPPLIGFDRRPRLAFDGNRGRSQPRLSKN